MWQDEGVPKHPKRPRDTNQLAKWIVDRATGQLEEPDPNAGKDAEMVRRGRLGGIKGGKARADKLGSAARKQSASHAATARWKRQRSGSDIAE